jgi:putative iron-regulated protein
MYRTVLIIFLVFTVLAADLRADSSRPSIPRPKLSLPLPGSAPAKTENVIERKTAEEVTQHYIVQAHARYLDSLAAAKLLFEATKKLVASPDETTHAAAKAAWIEAHKIYSRTEVLRFGNPNVDAWETRVNAWPIDEGFLDYVSQDYAYEGGNPHALYNLIGTDFQIASSFIVEARSETDPKAGVYRGFTDNETNVATGYHTIEFLLWGQDLNQSPRSAGGRPYSDYLIGEGGTGGNTKRRGDYLLAVGGILIADLLEAVQDWDPENRTLYSKVFSELPLEARLDRIILGMGGLSNAELAGERIQVALLASDQEEEQSCFSDTTHLALFENACAIETIYLGRDELSDGRIIQGPSMSSLVAKLDPDLDLRLRSEFAATMAAGKRVVKHCETVEPFDQMILIGNQAGRALLNEWIATLKKQTESIEAVRLRAAALAAIQ